MLALDLREWEEIARLTQTNSKKNRTNTHSHRYIKDLFIKFEAVEQKSHTHTQKYQLSEISSPTVKPFKPIKYTHKPIKNLMVFNHTTSRSFIIITITLSLFVTVKCIGYI